MEGFLEEEEAFTLSSQGRQKFGRLGMETAWVSGGQTF
jgi:hypothetical protein